MYGAAHGGVCSSSLAEAKLRTAGATSLDAFEERKAYDLTEASALVEMTGIDKRFGSTVALHGVDLSISAGQCLGLVGRNGAGKSTVVSILSGLEAPDAGTVRFSGEPAPRVGDVSRWRTWIATVFQHSMVVPDLTVAENVFLGSPETFVSWRQYAGQDE